MRLRRLFQSPEAKKHHADEKRRRISFLKGKHQAAYKPSEARAPRPPKPRLTLRRTARAVGTILTRVSKQARKMPSNRDMEKFVWGRGEQKKKG